MNPVYTIFNDIVSNMLRQEEGDQYISNALTVKGASGEEHTLSIPQLKLMMGMLDGSHEYLSTYNPLEFLLFSYQFQHLLKAKFVAVQYQVIYDHLEDSIFVSGVMRHPMTVPTHPDYVQGSYVPVETFQTTINDVGLYGALSLVNCIAAQDPKFAPIRGSFGGSYIYEHKDGQQSIRKYEMSELEQVGIDEPTIQEAIGEAIKKFNKTDYTPYTPPVITEPVHQGIDLSMGKVNLGSLPLTPNPYTDNGATLSGMM